MFLNMHKYQNVLLIFSLHHAEACWIHLLKLRFKMLSWRRIHTQTMPEENTSISPYSSMKEVKMTSEKQKWRSIVVLLGTKCQNLLGDETRGCWCLCLRGGSKEWRIWAPGMTQSPGNFTSFRGLQTSSSWGRRKDWQGSVKRKATCYYERQPSLKKGHIQQAELCWGVPWSTLCCPLPPGKKSVHPSEFQAQSPPRK